MPKRNTAKAHAEQAAHQAEPAPAANGAANAPERAPGAPTAPADTTHQAEKKTPKTRTRRKPGEPRNFREETRTYEQALAEAPPDRFPWPIPFPVHGIQGFTKLAGWKAQHALGGEQEPADIIGTAPDALQALISHAYFLATGEPVAMAPIAEHDITGKYFLKCARHPTGGFLIGIVDERPATLAGCEWYDSLEDAQEAWVSWVKVVSGIN